MTDDDKADTTMPDDDTQHFFLRDTTPNDRQSFSDFPTEAETHGPPPPSDAKVAGRRLWAAVLDDFDLAEHELALLRQAVRVADLCEDLADIVARDGLMRDGRIHPAVVELRAQRILLARLVVALRVPLGEQEDGGADRTQYRGARGFYAVKGGAS